MSGFRSTSLPDEPTSPRSAHADAVYIPPGTTVEGPLQTSAPAWLGGTIRGDVRVEAAVLILEPATVRGAVAGASAQISGRVEGGIVVSGKLVLASTARVEGDLTCSKLIVEHGAVFTGDCHMEESSRAPEIDVPERSSSPVENGEHHGDSPPSTSDHGPDLLSSFR